MQTMVLVGYDEKMKFFLRSSATSELCERRRGRLGESENPSGLVPSRISSEPGSAPSPALRVCHDIPMMISFILGIRRSGWMPCSRHWFAHHRLACEENNSGSVRCRRTFHQPVSIRMMSFLFSLFSFPLSDADCAGEGQRVQME